MGRHAGLHAPRPDRPDKRPGQGRPGVGWGGRRSLDGGGRAGDRPPPRRVGRLRDRPRPGEHVRQRHPRQPRRRTPGRAHPRTRRRGRQAREEPPGRRRLLRPAVSNGPRQPAWSHREHRQHDRQAGPGRLQHGPRRGPARPRPRPGLRQGQKRSGETGRQQGRRVEPARIAPGRERPFQRAQRGGPHPGPGRVHEEAPTGLARGRPHRGEGVRPALRRGRAGTGGARRERYRGAGRVRHNGRYRRQAEPGREDEAVPRLCQGDGHRGRGGRRLRPGDGGGRRDHNREGRTAQPGRLRLRLGRDTGCGLLRRRPAETRRRLHGRHRHVVHPRTGLGRPLRQGCLSRFRYGTPGELGPPSQRDPGVLSQPGGYSSLLQDLCRGQATHQRLRQDCSAIPPRHTDGGGSPGRASRDPALRGRFEDVRRPRRSGVQGHTGRAWRDGCH
uniref:FunJ1 n=1 Tax=Streptosporangium sp. KD35 TaxID=2162663 RepID=A0A2U9KD15_9ACTN|nr:FunJ1 [Streptosporangium sp. KD35]